jgi:hypothetical protein
MTIFVVVVQGSRAWVVRWSYWLNVDFGIPCSFFDEACFGNCEIAM